MFLKLPQRWMPAPARPLKSVVMPEEVVMRLGLSICFSLFLAITAKPGELQEISSADKVAILQLAFEIKLKREGPEKFAEYLTISTENMSNAMLPKLPGFEFKLMPPNQIKKRQKKADRFRYLLVSEFTKRGRFIDLSLGIIERCGGLPCHSHSYRYAFEKIDGKWQGQIYLIIC